MDIDQLHKDIYAAQQSDKHCTDIITNITNPEFPNPNPDGHWTTNNFCAMITEFGILILMIFGSEFYSISRTIYYLATTVKARLWN